MAKKKLSNVRWDRKLWGVSFSGTLGESILIDETWDQYRAGEVGIPGEPIRALLFITRTAARDWCKAKMQRYKERNDRCEETGCTKWRFKPVRVRELVTVIKK